MDNYWDFISQKGLDNIWKRKEIVSRVLNLDLVDKIVLDIGIGLGNCGCAVVAAMNGSVKYVGTDLSERNCLLVRKRFGIETYCAPVDALPFHDNQFDYVFAFDMLEHVEDKGAGYKEISRVLKEHAGIVLNIPLNESAHDPQYEFGFTDHDLFTMLKVCSMRLDYYETYSVMFPNANTRTYAFAVGAR